LQYYQKIKKIKIILKDREGKEQNKSQLLVTPTEISALKGNYKHRHTSEVAATKC